MNSRTGELSLLFKSTIEMEFLPSVRGLSWEMLDRLDSEDDSRVLEGGNEDIVDGIEFDVDKERTV